MYTEKSPLTGGSPSYSFQNPNRIYKKQVKRFQCLLCSIVLGLFAVALITSAMLYIDVDEIGGSSEQQETTNENDTMLARLQSSPGDHGKKNVDTTSGLLAPKPPKPIKLYTSGTVIRGTVTGGVIGEEPHQIFDGTLPATIHLDPIIDPDAWSATADITWAGVALNNNTVAGTLLVPFKLENGTNGVIEKIWSGTFEIELAFKWSSNLEMIIPNKMYHCKAIFLTAYKSTLSEYSDIARATTKGKTDENSETCSITLQGSFYEKSFFCVITPWWCSDEKLFYWNGGLEFKITKPPVQPQLSTNTEPTSQTPSDVANENALRPVLNSGLKEATEKRVPVFVGWKILGKVANGWVNVQNDSDSRNIWSGVLPSEISFPLFYNNDTRTSGDGLDIIWSCSVFSNSVRGNFRLALNSKLGLSKWIKGSFFFLLDSTPSPALNTALDSGVVYKSSLHFRDSTEVINGTQVINFYPHNTSAVPNFSWFRAPIILLGKTNRMSKLFEWDGRFEIIAKRDTNPSNASFQQSSGSDDMAQKAGGGNEVTLHSMLVDGSSNDVGNSFNYNQLQSQRPPATGLSNGAGENIDTVIQPVVGSKLLGSVVSGWITVSEDSKTKLIWDGKFPTDISVPMFYNPTTDMSDLSDEYGHGVVWSCSVFQSTLKGSFQVPQYTKFGLVKWLQGNFFFQLKSSPYWSLYDTVVPGINYYSPLHFRKTGTGFNDTRLINFHSYIQTSPLDDSGFKVPIVLLGKAGQGKSSKSFLWDGRFVFVTRRFF